VPSQGRPRRAPGIKLERQVLVTEDGSELLSAFPLAGDVLD
jgi:Xaa-Pro aminopeptidase